jgi:hypothetical protein
LALVLGLSSWTGLGLGLGSWFLVLGSWSLVLVLVLVVGLLRWCCVFIRSWVLGLELPLACCLLPLASWFVLSWPLAVVSCVLLARLDSLALSLPPLSTPLPPFLVLVLVIGLGFWLGLVAPLAPCLAFSPPP